MFIDITVNFFTQEVNNLKERLQSEQKRNGDVEHQQEESIVPVKV